MKCLFCCFNEIFNGKVSLRSSSSSEQNEKMGKAREKNTENGTTIKAKDDQRKVTNETLFQIILSASRCMWTHIEPLNMPEQFFKTQCEKLFKLESALRKAKLFCGWE